MMKKIIENIRNRPEPIRRRIILVSALALTGLVVLFWILALPYRFTGAGREFKESIRPFESLKDNVSSTIKGVSNVIK